MENKMSNLCINKAEVYIDKKQKTNQNYKYVIFKEKINLLK